MDGNRELSTQPTQEEIPEGEVMAFVVHTLSFGVPSYYLPAFIMHEFEEYSYKEIAGVLGRSIPSLKTAIFRARMRLRRHAGEILPARSQLDVHK